MRSFELLQAGTLVESTVTELEINFSLGLSRVVDLRELLLSGPQGSVRYSHSSLSLRSILPIGYLVGKFD